MAAKTAGPSFDEIARDVKAGNFKPIYYLMGDEDYYIDRLSQLIVDNALAEDERDFNLDVLYGGDCTANQVIQFAQGLPMMAPRRVVLLREAQQMDDRENLAAYAQHLNPSTVLVVCHKHGRLDARRQLAQEVKRVGVLFESMRLRDYQLPGFINSYFKAQHKEIEPAASQMLCEFVGSDLSRLSSEMEKLLLATPQDQVRITASLVEEQTGVSKDYNVFELQNALAARDVVKANRIVNYFDNNPRSFALPPMLSALFGFFSDVMMAYYATERSESGLANWLGRSPWHIKDSIMPALQKYSAMKVIRILSEIRSTDAKSKGVGGCRTAPGALLRELVFFILH